MPDAVRFTRKSARSDFYPYVLPLFCVISLGLAGCSGMVNANGGNPGGPPTTLTISSVQAATPTTSGFQVSWSTNVAANSVVDYGTSASYGSSTPVNSTMVTSHQLALTSLTTGTLYHFRVRSTDAKGNTAASSDMTFSTAGDTTPPTVSITSPAANATLAGSVTVTASATDDVAVASVQFRVDNANTGAAITAAPYSYLLNTTTLSNGNHTIMAVAADTSGNTATSLGVTVTVNNTATTVPSIASLNPTSGPVGTSVTIAGTNFGLTQGTSTVTFNGVAAKVTSWSAASVVALVPAGATTGNVVVTVSGVSSSGVSFTVGGAGPVISQINVSGITTSSSIVSWTTDVPATTQVEYGTTTVYGNLTPLNSTLSTSHSQALAGLTAGTLYHYRVRSKNSSGVESISGDFAFQTNSVVDTTPPTVSITAPANGASVSGTASVSANASDNVGVASVQFTLDGSNLGSALTASPYQVAWDTTTTSNGSHLVSAVARDAAGNVGNATAVSVTVSNSGNTALQDFQSRCAAPSVIVCEGFDSAAEFVPALSPNTGLYPGVDNTIEIVQDTSVFTSGGGSLHFPIKVNDGTGPTVRDDNWLQTFCSAHPPAPCSPTVFGPNSTFYVQFRYRVDAGYANTNWEDSTNGASSPKIADFSYHNSNCGATEITTNNRNGTGRPMMYTNCGSGTYGGIYTLPGTTNVAQTTNPPYSWQSGYYNCSYPSTPSGPGGCFTMPANTWMTFYYAIQLGSNGQFNSHITAWIGPDGQPLQKFMDVSNFPLSFDTPGYDAIWFNVYMTGFLSTATNPAANAWLDEVIVSSAPVPAPAANGGGIPQ